MPREKRITKTQSVGFYDSLAEDVQRIADARFNGNFNMAINFLAKLGVESDKAQNWGGGQVDRKACAGASHA